MGAADLCLLDISTAKVSLSLSLSLSLSRCLLVLLPKRVSTVF